MRNDLLKQFVAFVQAQNMRLSERRALLAVSGGTDSVVLCDLFYKAGFRFGIAHCNFQLRGAEADEDELFCKALAKQYKVPFFSVKFDTKSFAEKEKLSIQEAARKLRYDWFFKLQKEERFYYLATAHHADDNAETILYNFIKGTGINGLRGILPKKDTLLRPLLFAEKKQITNYLQQNNLHYREDSSNQLDKYSRNKIRLHILPEIENINPSFSQTINVNAKHYLQLAAIEQSEIKKQARKIIQRKGDKLYFGIKNLLAEKNPQQFLYHQLHPFGFTLTQVENSIACLSGTESKYFETDTHRLLKERKSLLLEEKKGGADFYAEIYQLDKEVQLPNGTLSFQQSAAGADFSKKNNIAALDLHKIELPLIIRKLKTGDYFYPIGMNGKKKKISKFLKDIKATQSEKENILVVTSNQRVVWVVGHRIDERFKIAASTTETVRIVFSKKQN